MDAIVWLLLALGFGFLAYLLYTGQFRWLFGVVRNMVLGVAGILGVNALLSGIGLAAGVGVNAVTTLVIGLLGVPGFLLLYGVQLLL